MAPPDGPPEVHAATARGKLVASARAGRARDFRRAFPPGPIPAVLVAVTAALPTPALPGQVQTVGGALPCGQPPSQPGLPELPCICALMLPPLHLPDTGG